MTCPRRNVRRWKRNGSAGDERKMAHPARRPTNKVATAAKPASGIETRRLAGAGRAAASIAPLTPEVCVIAARANARSCAD